MRRERAVKVKEFIRIAKREVIKYMPGDLERKIYKEGKRECSSEPENHIKT